MGMQIRSKSKARNNHRNQSAQIVRFMKTGKIAFYYRVSTGGQNLDSQRVELQRYAEQQGWKPEDILTFEDHAVSGGVFSRKGLDEMMRAVKRGRVRLVVCSRLDRLGRSLSGVAMLLSELQANGVGLICCQQGLNTSDDSPMGRLQAGILAIIGEFEKSLCRERTLAGLAAARAKGKTLGRPDTLSKFIPEVQAILAEGECGPAEISRRLGIPLSSAAKVLNKAKTV